MSNLRTIKRKLNQVKVARAIEKAESDKNRGVNPFSNRRSQRPQSQKKTTPNVLEVTVDNSVVTDVKYSKV